MTGNERKLPYKPCICPTMRKIDYVTRVKFWLISVCMSHLVVILSTVRRTDEQTHTGWTDRRDVGNSILDLEVPTLTCCIFNAP